MKINNNFLAKRFPAFCVCLTFFTLFNAQTPLVFSDTGAGTWTAPCDVTSITVEVWGGGGGGSAVDGNGSSGSIKGGGGSGGGFVSTTYTVTPGYTYKYSVGAGGTGLSNSTNNGSSSWFGSEITLLAVGGRGAAAYNVVTGQTARTTGNVGGSISTYGGNGGDSGASFSGGGGSSAGNTAGNSASGSTGGSAPANGFAGAGGLTASGTGADADRKAGAGGSGGYKPAGNSTRNGGRGGNGQIRITYTSAFKNYCNKSYDSVEPITNVTFAGINNSTSGTVGGTLAREYFCITASVIQGATYPISVRGNTNGDFTNYFRVYFDWNQNGTFDDAGEVYDIGTIRNSLGNTLTATLNVTVPMGALLGNTRMRVTKNYGGYTDACSTASFGQAEEYIVNVAAPQACSGTPDGGTVSLSTASGLPSSAFTASVSGSSNTSGLVYQWESAPTESGTWTPIPDATSAAATITAISTTGITYYRRKITCTASGSSVYSPTVSYTTQYCAPGVTGGIEANNYIKMVKFIGTLQDTSQPSTYSSSPSGYQDYTANVLKSIQAQGNGINLYVENFALGNVRAWVDWNRNGTFDNTGEEVYTSGGTSIVSTTFGFVIPNAASVGDYTLRIRMNVGSNFTPCNTLSTAGETEDYLFTVIPNCAATVTGVTDGIRFGAGAVNLQVKTSASSTEVRWYDSLMDGNLMATTPVVGGISSWTPTISSTTVYYAEAWNGSCKSLVRIAVKATIRPIPVITFTPETPTTCGSNSTVKISAGGQNETNYLIEEDFENGLGEFTSRNLVLNGSTIDPKTQWKIQTSTYTPKDQVWFPAIASGTSGNKFVMSTSDVGNYTVDNELVSPERNTADYLTLVLSFRMYYSKYSNDEVDDASDYVAIEVNNGGAEWIQVEKIIKDVGYGTEFALRTIDMSSYKNSKFRFRIRYYGKYKDGVAVDDVELYGVRPLTATFAWTTSAPINTFTDAATTIPYIEGTGVTTVYMNPSLAQKEATNSWTINATASLTNGSTATGTVTIENKNKVWNVPGNKWSDTSWRPAPLLPTISDCVYIKTPVIITPGTSGFAKEVFVQSGGKLTISTNASLTVKDAFANYAGTDDVVIESNGGLVQINNSSTINTGNITAKRTLNLSAGRQQYNFVASPLEGQSLRSIYSGIDYVLYHNEANNFFYSSSGAYIKGRGLAVKEPNVSSLSSGNSTVSALFKGYPTNGTFTYGIVNTNVSQAKRGFNLIGNPYPSNIDLLEFYALNGGTSGRLSSTFYLWDNRANSQTVQKGDLYEGQAYAQFNAEHGTGTVATGDVDLAGTNIPSSIIKMGQAFMVKTSASSQQLTFNNTIRTGDNGTVSFFGKAGKPTAASVDRYWLNLITPGNEASNIAIVYFDGGTKAFSKDDSFSMGGSDVVYSWAGNEKVSINGRSSFDEDDFIPLGTVHFVNGRYTFALQKKEGIFAAGQNIYLKDKHAGVITNLSKGNYSFDATKGESTGRFEIIYRSETVMGTDGTVKEEIQVYRDGKNFVVKAQTKKITALELYDASGRMLHQSTPNSLHALVNSESLNNGVYLLKIIQNDVVSIKKIIR